MTAGSYRRKLAAILSADVKGYSRLMSDDEAATVNTLTAYRQVMISQIKEHNGRVVDAKGDNLLAEFISVVDAVNGAVKIQQELKAKNAELPDHRKMEFRIGINLGDVIEEEENIYGDGVNIAARLEGLAEAGGICVSRLVYDQVKKKLDLGYEYMGDHAVKNIDEPVKIYRLFWESEKPMDEKEPAASSVDRDKPDGSDLKLPDRPSIVVLPFVNMSGDPEQEYFSDGLTEDLITDLSKISGMFVIARNSAFTFKGRSVKIGQVAQELGVRYVLEGSVRKAGGRVRITSQLIDATSEYHLWAERYDSTMEDIFDLQDKVTRQIVEALEVNLTLSEEERLARQRTVNPQAYDCLLQANSLIARTTKESNLAARRMYERTIELDPDYADAYAGLGMTYFMEWPFGWSKSPKVLERAMELGQKALAMDNSVPWARMLCGWVHLWKKEHDQALAAGRAVLTLEPNNADTLAFMGYALAFADRPEEAMDFIRRAMRLNPHHPFFYSHYLGIACYLLKQYDEAATEFKKSLAENPDFVPANIFLAQVYAETNQIDKARETIKAILRTMPDFSVEMAHRLTPYKNPATLKRHTDNFSKIGLK